MKAFLLILAAIGGALLPLQVHGGIVMQLRDQQTVACANLTLNDLLNASEGLSTDDLSTVIAATPSLGKSETWTRDRLEAVLPASIKQQSFEWAGATACVVKRPAVEYSQEEVKQLIIAELQRHLPENSDFAILELPGVDPFLIPDGELDTRVELGSGSLRNEWGEATLEFRSQGQLAVTKSVRFHWAYTRPVWQASDRIADGNPLVRVSAGRSQHLEDSRPFAASHQFPRGQSRRASHPAGENSHGNRLGRADAREKQRLGHDPLRAPRHLDHRSGPGNGQRRAQRSHRRAKSHLSQNF